MKAIRLPGPGKTSVAGHSNQKSKNQPTLCLYECLQLVSRMNKPVKKDAAFQENLHPILKVSAILQY
jgi:hypothetical protein